MAGGTGLVHVTRDYILKTITIPCLVFFLMIGGVNYSGIHRAYGQLRDRNELVMGADFFNSWAMGNFARTQNQPERNYDIGYYNDQLTVRLGEDYTVQQWSYPPTYGFLMVPFGWLPYLLAWPVSVALSVAVFLYAMRRVFPTAWRLMAAAALVSPAACMAILSGQLALMFAAVQLGFFQLLDRRPYLAGVLLGFLSVKPQLGLLYPWYLIATRRWKSFAAASATTLGLIAASALGLGPAWWHAYFSWGIPMQYTYVFYHTPHTVRLLMPTLLMDLKTAGISHEAGMVVQALMAFSVVIVLFTRRFRALTLPAQRVVMATGSVVASPYLMPYDLIFLTAASLGFFYGKQVGPREMALLLMAVWLPVIHYICAVMGIPGSSLLPLFLLHHAMVSPQNRMH